jgi:hypothetical protein
MIYLFLSLITFLNFSQAGTPSILVTKVFEAAQLRENLPELKSSKILREDLVLILNLLEKHEIPSSRIEHWAAIDPARFDLVLIPPEKVFKSGEVYPPMALHAHKFLVVEESDDVTNDDIYVSFFITDGNVPTGKVTSVYRGLDEGDSFFFTLVDRVLFPVTDPEMKRPRGHLIIDYMIIESDGDDISELRRISSFITELAIEFYKRKYGSEDELSLLREEVRALSEALLNLNHDDRLVSATWAPGPEEVNELLRWSSFAEVTKTHKESSPWGDFKYKITFRLIR